MGSMYPRADRARQETARWNDFILGTANGACRRRDAAAAASTAWKEDRKHPPRSRSLPFDLTNGDGDQLDATPALIPPSSYFGAGGG